MTSGRISGATPTSPIFTVSSGAIANVNNNDGSTSTATFTLTNLIGATVANRTLARLALPSAITLVKIELIGGQVPTGGSSSSGQWFAYSTNNGSTWTAVGTSFVWNGSVANYDTGAISIAGVTDVAVCMSDQNWGGGSFTAVIGDLNAYN